MKMYSSDMLTKEQVEATVSSAVTNVAETVSQTVDAIDAKQNRQIKQLRILVAAAFAVNILVSVLLFASL